MHSCDSSPAQGVSHSGTVLLVDDEQPLLDIYMVKPISIPEIINVVQAAALVHDSIVAATK